MVGNGDDGWAVQETPPQQMTLNSILSMAEHKEDPNEKVVPQDS